MDPPDRVPSTARLICPMALSSRNTGGADPPLALGVFVPVRRRARRDTGQSRNPCFGVCSVGYEVLAVKETWNIEVRTDILYDHVGRVAPVTDCNVPVRKSESFQRRAIGAFDDLQSCSGFVIEHTRIHGACARQVLAHGLLKRPKARRGAIREPGAERNLLAPVHAQRCCTFRLLA